jgi:succinate dehydrogenase / fumarate reductase, cytochrome b subunit
MSLIGNLFTSSIGRKILMAVSGVILIGFVFGHLVGNLQVFAHPDKINGYAHFLQSLGPVLWIVRLTLLATVAIHIWAAIVLTLENRQARGAQGYGVNAVIQATVASRYMRLTGLVVLAFIIYHLAHFTLGAVGHDTYKGTLPEYTMSESFHLLGFPVVEKGQAVHDVYSMIYLGFATTEANPYGWLISVFYVIATGLLAFHLLHGIDSMFQTLGWRSHKWACCLRKAAAVLCLLYFLGNLAIPGAIAAGLVKPASGTAAAASCGASCCELKR